MDSDNNKDLLEHLNNQEDDSKEVLVSSDSKIPSSNTKPNQNQKNSDSDFVKLDDDNQSSAQNPEVVFPAQSINLAGESDHLEEPNLSGYQAAPAIEENLPQTTIDKSIVFDPSMINSYYPGYRTMEHGIKIQEEVNHTDLVQSSRIFRLPKFAEKYADKNPDGIEIDPATVFNDVTSIIIVPNKDIYSMTITNGNFFQGELSYQILDNTPNQSVNENKKHLFTCVEHNERPEGCQGSRCFYCCCMFCCCPIDTFKYQMDYQFKGKNFATLFKERKTSCFCCRPCINLFHLCDDYEDVNIARIAKYPQKKYLKLSRPIGYTAMPRSCDEKIAQIIPLLQCCSAKKGNSIDYIDLNLHPKYRLGFPKTGLTWGCCQCCICNQTYNDGRCCGMSCCVCDKERNYFVNIINLQTKEISGYVLHRFGQSKEFNICGCCFEPRAYYPNDHLIVYFPKEANSLEKFMILNLVINWRTSHKNAKIGIDVHNFITFKQIHSLYTPNHEEMELLKPKVIS